MLKYCSLNSKVECYDWILSSVIAVLIHVPEFKPIPFYKNQFKSHVPSYLNHAFLVVWNVCFPVVAVYRCFFFEDEEMYDFQVMLLISSSF